MKNYFQKYPRNTILLMLTMTLLNACKTPDRDIEIKNGDLLFCGYSQDGLTGAIDEVTQTDKSTHFSHMGIIEISGADTFVIHASTKKGVNKELLSTFIANQEAAEIVQYRLQPQFLTSLDSILAAANNLIGLPYNFSYLPTDSAYYCSQLIYKLFENQKVFNLEPMTFKNPETGEFNAVWVDHYQKLGIPIPEGVPGCNPNGLAASDKLMRIKRIQ